MKIKNKTALKGICTTLLAACMLTSSALSSVGAVTVPADSSVGASASGVTAATPAEDFAYEENSDGGITITGYTGSDTEIDIPSEINGKSVTEIGDSAFRGYIKLTSITIPDSVTRIGGLAFYACPRLKSITIPDSVTYIGGFAFENCTGLTSITIPDSVTEIDICAFEGCTGLTSITIPESVTEIGQGAFNGCNNLTIYGHSGSYAETYANDHDIPFIALNNTGNPGGIGGGDDIVYPGGVVRFSAYVHGPVNVLGYESTLYYNYSATTVESVTQGLAFPEGDDWFGQAYDAFVYVLNTTYAKATVTDVALIYEIVFNVTEEVSVSDIIINDNTYIVADTWTEHSYDDGYVSSTIEVLDYGQKPEEPDKTLFGDVNGDGEVTAKDRITLTRNLAKWADYAEINQKNSDLNGDNEVNAKDRIILTRHLAKWSDYKTLPKLD